MRKVLQSYLGSLLLGGLSFLLTTGVLLYRPLLNAASRAGNESSKETGNGFWERHNSEVDELVREVRREKEDLARREAELRELAIRLQAERAEINAVTQRVAQMQAEFDQNVVRVREEEIPNLKRLARVYSSMSTESTSAILKELDDQTVVKIFSMMKEGDSASLLELMARESEAQAKRAAMISESLRRTITDKKKTP